MAINNGPRSSVDITKVVNTLGSISTINTIADFNLQKPILLQAVTDLKTHLTDSETQVNNLKTTIAQLNSLVTSLTGERDALMQDNQTKQDTIDRLNTAAAAAQAAQSAKPLDLATAFQSVLSTVQQQARDSTASSIATLRNLDVEVKGIVNMQTDMATPSAPPTTVLVLPTAGAPIDPAQLSTMRMSFAAVPNLGAVAPQPAPAPPASARSPSSPPPPNPTWPTSTLHPRPEQQEASAPTATRRGRQI